MIADRLRPRCRTEYNSPLLGRIADDPDRIGENATPQMISDRNSSLQCDYCKEQPLQTPVTGKPASRIRSRLARSQGRDESNAARPRLY
jgi:hypothetical protein